MTDPRVDKLETDVTDLKVAIGGMQKDIHSMAESVRSIDQSIKKFSEIHQTLMVRDEHFIGLLKDVKGEVEIAKLMAEAAQDMVNKCSATQEKRIEKLEDSISWAVRVVLGVVIVALLSLVIINKDAAHETLQSVGFYLQRDRTESDEPALPLDVGRIARAVWFSFHDHQRFSGDDS